MKHLIGILVVLGLITIHTTRANQFQLSCIGSDNRSTSNVGNEGATRLKNRVKGPADLAIYYINSPGVSCGGFKTAQCSTSCGALGYPVYWCYPKVCYCHYGNSDQEENGIDDVLPE